jgi:DNA primase
VQRIFLTAEGYSSKLSLGPLKGGAVRLTPPAPSLQVCESVEDGLALWQMTGRPTWACLGTAMLAAFEPPQEAREVILAPDHDKAGPEAIAKAADHFNGIKLRQLLPPEGMDWCEVLERTEERAATLEFEAELIREEAETRSWAEAFSDGD